VIGYIKGMTNAKSKRQRLEEVRIPDQVCTPFH
jgi:hypothetical protein